MNNKYTVTQFVAIYLEPILFGVVLFLLVLVALGWVETRERR